MVSLGEETEGPGEPRRSNIIKEDLPPVTSSPKRLLGIVSTASTVGVLALFAAPASAGAAAVSLSACDSASLSQPFTPWADFNSYKLAPGGDFETSAAGWSLSGGATPVTGSETYGVSGSVGDSSLSLPDGASASSPTTCVNAAYPSFRFFARSDQPGASVGVSVVYSGAFGTVVIPVGVVYPDSDWQPTLPMLTGSAIPGAVNGGTAAVSLRFTVTGGTAQIDDVYVDPVRRCC